MLQPPLPDTNVTRPFTGAGAAARLQKPWWCLGSQRGSFPQGQRRPPPATMHTFSVALCALALLVPVSVRAGCTVPANPPCYKDPSTDKRILGDGPNPIEDGQMTLQWCAQVRDACMLGDRRTRRFRWPAYCRPSLDQTEL